jgi:hypothetical protein
VGLPQRWGQRHPYYEFQEKILNIKEPYIAIEKPPKIGMTELWLNLAMHQACINEEWKYGQVAIVVGTSGLNEAEKMIGRCKDTLEIKDQRGYGVGEYLLPVNEDYNTKKEFSLNTVEFRAHPADNIDSIRSQPNMRMIIIDEAAFFRRTDQQSVRDAVEHYIAGSNVIIVWISTAGDVPEGAFYDIMTEEKSLYKRIMIDYTEGLKKHPESGTSLYLPEMIEQLRNSASFARNFLHVWGHGSGDVFERSALEKCTQDYTVKLSEGESVLSIDPGFGSSNSGILGMVKIDGIIYITEAYELERPSDTALIEHILDKSKYYNNTAIDGHWAGIVRGLEERGVRVEPIKYANHLQNMTSRSSEKVKELSVRIKPEFTKLLEQLRAAKYNDKGVVNKKIMNFDLGDCFLQGIHLLYDEGASYAYQEPD